MNVKTIRLLIGMIMDGFSSARAVMAKICVMTSPAARVREI
jgi:hypothetical protein